MDTPTVSQVTTWAPQELAAQAREWQAAAEQIRGHLDTAARAIDTTHDFWTGDAAHAMRADADAIHHDTTTVHAALTDGADTARTGAAVISAARDAALATIRAAEANRFFVADNGTVTVPPHLYAWLFTTAEPASALVAKAALESEARHLQWQITHALDAVGQADQATATAIRHAFAALTDRPHDDTRRHRRPPRNQHRPRPDQSSRRRRKQPPQHPRQIPNTRNAINGRATQRYIRSRSPRRADSDHWFHQSRRATGQES